ncbi:gamma-glutamylcyclotransferase [Roseomonas sp. PWR1]|uniref:Putative gamma-glutamylcyclotransferase n=1 Tax=Roseomonas nitratireducens TaxID=2820810 RepID=A0ABS4AUL9_9PROT|nr:gamma-glutamylcyclotransferase family protein [Neoroseomonas nitratireducens]MBP0465063.1 gamma-glutamylcyclotransferase [Neoroseomonas nitratireducens]
MTPLFVYGTLLDPDVLARMSGEPSLPRRMMPARLEGWRRVHLRGTPYPTLVEDAGAAVEGAVVRAGPAALARLSDYEGSAYALVPLTVATPRGPMRARAWIAPTWRADLVRPWPG